MKRAMMTMVLLLTLAGCGGGQGWELRNPFAGGQGQTVYHPSECVGSVINDSCYGSIVPSGGVHQTCHGEMVGGICTGPMF